LDSKSVIDPRRVFLAPVRFLPHMMSHIIPRHQRSQRKISSKAIWGATIDRFEVFRNNLEGHYG
jgi:hypothetical protein